MTTSPSNFALLDAHLPHVAEVGRRAEGYFNDDPNTCLFKLRQFIEQLAAELANRHRVYLGHGAHLNDVLDALRDSGQVSEFALGLFHGIRRAGNRAAHSTRGEHGEAARQLRNAYQLVIGFVAEFGDPDVRAPGFVLPPPPPDPSAELERVRADQAAIEQRLQHSEAERERFRQTIEAQAAALARPTVALSSSFTASFAALDDALREALTPRLVAFRNAPDLDAVQPFDEVDEVDRKLGWVEIADRVHLVVAVAPSRDAVVCAWIGDPQGARDWAVGRRIDVHPELGHLQIYDLAAPQRVDADPTSSSDAHTGLFAAWTDDDLHHVGLPPLLTPAVRAVASAQDFAGLCQHLPPDAAHALGALLEGKSTEEARRVAGLRKPAHAVDTDQFDVALGHESSHRQVAAVDDDDALEAILAAPLEQWRVFLHPSQRRIVETRSNGPVRVLGGAGTGKTVVLMHRAVHLVRNVLPADARVFVTTYTRNLAGDIADNLARLASPDELARLEVDNLHRHALRLVREHGARRSVRMVDGKTQRKLWRGAIDEADPEQTFSDAFYREEWQHVVQAQGITDKRTYLRARRAGRGTGLNRRQRMRVWAVMSAYRRRLDDQGLLEWPDLVRLARELLEQRPELARHRAVLADEIQDFAPEELRLLRAMVAEGPDDLFLVGDAHQRIYGQPTSMSQCGIAIRGRSFRLKINYRTTAEIQRLAVATLDDAPVPIDDLDGGDDAVGLEGLQALRSGPAPEVVVSPDRESELEVLVSRVTAWLAQTRPEAICVSARNSSIVHRCRRALEAADIETCVVGREGAGGPGVRLATMHRMKGLEFERVLLVAIQPDVVPEPRGASRLADEASAEDHERQERCLLYVAATRARDALVISAVGQLSPWVHIDLPVAAPVVQQPTSATYRISPSAISRYFFFDCPRHLRLGVAAGDEREALGVPARDYDASPLRDAILESGYSWEETVVRDHLGDAAVVSGVRGRLHTRRFGVRDTVGLLRRARPGRALYQLTLRAPDVFYRRHGIDRALVRVSDNMPDLVMVHDDGAGGRLLRVIDIKRGDAMRSMYRVQILLYALQLAAILEAEGIDDARVDLDQGAVWLGGHDRPQPCDLTAIRPHVERFLRHDLQALLRKPVADAFWHVQFRCEWCDFFQHCWDEMQTTDDVSRLPRLTAYGKRFLQERAGVGTVAALRQYLALDDVDASLSACASLTGQRPRLQSQVDALVDGTPRLHHASSAALPRRTRTEVAVFVTVQREPLGRRVYLAGTHIQAGDDVPTARLPVVARSLDPQVRVAEVPDDGDSVSRWLVTELHALMVELDAWNADREWRDQFALQVFVHTALERDVLVELLIAALDDPALRVQAMTVLFYLRTPELIRTERHPDAAVPFPVVVLQSALGRLLAVPVDVSHTLPETLESLGSEYHYHRNEDFHFPLGHGLRAEPIHAAWHEGESENLGECQAQGEKHLRALRALLSSLRERADGYIFAWPPKFRLPSISHIADPLLSRLAFFARYESLLQCTDLRETRMESREVQALTGQVIELEAISATTMRLVGNAPVELDASTFPSWLLVRDTAEGRRAQLEYTDYGCRNRHWAGRKSPHRAVVGLEAVDDDALGFTERVTVTYAVDFEGVAPPQPGDRLLLYPRFTDYTSDRVVDFLETLDAQPHGDNVLLGLLRGDDVDASRALAEPVEAACRSLEPSLSLTASQRTAFRVIRERRVLAVWGPPGTGKTHFLASVVVGQALAHRRAGRPFRVLVTAFTHAAIENLLHKIASRLAALDPGLDLEIAKAKAWHGAELGEAIDEKKVPAWLAARPRAVIGATVYTCLKKRPEPFDLVLVDEASQVRVPEAMIPASLVAPGGALVLAGDDLQLPPIVQGQYPEPRDETEVVLHRSVFEALRSVSRTGHPDLFATLLENFRMNAVLTGVAAGLLYGPGYQCATRAVAERRLPWMPSERPDAVVAALLEPSASLVVAVVEGGEPARDSELEASLVAAVVAELREGLVDDDGLFYETDEDFFAHGTFVVSPHHSQLRLIRRALAAARTWQTPPLADTVEKLQGREAEVVVVSYGVSDPEHAMREAAFIYAANRLNVAVTRARSKTIVFVSRALLEASPQILEVPEAAAGLGFMRGLVEHCEREGKPRTVRLDGERSLTLFARHQPEV